MRIMPMDNGEAHLVENWIEEDEPIAAPNS